MKRLIASLLLALGLLFAPVAASAVSSPYWELNMYNPATTTDRKINIAYHVLSTTKTDTFKVELFQGITKVAENNITHEYGDSDAFTVDLPASGTYTYKTVATNNADASTKEESRTIQVVDGPQPTVTTVFVTNPNQTQGGGGGTGTGATTGATAGGATQGTATTSGQVGDSSSTDQPNEDVLGAEAQDQKEDSNTSIVAWIIIAAAVVLGAGYYWFYIRQSKNLLGD